MEESLQIVPNHGGILCCSEYKGRRKAVFYCQIIGISIRNFTCSHALSVKMTSDIGPHKGTATLIITATIFVLNVNQGILFGWG